VSKGHELSLSGTEAHPQNGVVERAIKTTVSLAGAMLFHMVLHWPERADLMLWPFALEYAMFIWNHLPHQKTGLCPKGIFTSSKVDVGEILQRLREWGCQTYVLDPTFQDGKKLPMAPAIKERAIFGL
jgi:hypothetical protein